MKYAIISDIHGNLPAFESVYSNILKEKVDKIINCGDSLYGPLWPEETAKKIIENNIISILGNGDEQLIQNPDISRTFAYSAKQLSNTTKEWLKDLHLQYYDNNIFAFHASPLNNQEYFFEKIDNGIVTIKGNNELLKTINNIGQKYIVFGHSHIERVISVDKYVCINAGSVGLPAYDDENPYHKMESFNQKAKYVIINNNEITIKYIDYNYKDAAKQAVKNDRRDWEKWILDGRV